jgi:XTP/dITP diphosphohydrolase
MRIIFATSNKDKLKEIKEILSLYDIEVISLREADIHVDIEENGSTFEENAIIKAQTVMRLTKSIVMADDSGLEVDYINGEPGIYSARYLGEDTSYIIKNKSIIDRLADAEGQERSARFVCAIATAFPDGKIITTRGTVEGLIDYEEKGDNGFGYDPIFYVPQYNQTMAQIPFEVKNKISHRYKALCLMGEKLRHEDTDCK